MYCKHYNFQIKYKIPKLKKGVLPRKFPNCPKYLSTNEIKKRKSPKKRQVPKLNNPHVPEATENLPEATEIKDSSDIRKIPVSADYDTPERLENTIFEFETIFNDTKSVKFPIPWASSI